VAAAFALLHVMLYVFRREDRGNLYLAVGAPPSRQRPRSGTATVMIAATMIMILAFIRFAHWFTHVEPPRLLYSPG
jgi:hypothetical protein